jgi:lactoylglutathione lyase
VKIKTYGIVLGVKHFHKCVRFYRDIVGLPVWFEKADLSCFRFGDGYLMVETEEAASDFAKPGEGHRTMLRFNVDDVAEAARELRRKDVAVDVEAHSWGIVGKFYDPDRNVCELKNADDPFVKL